MEALVCAFSELRITEDAVSQTQGQPSCSDMSQNIYEGGLGTQQQCPSAEGSKPKNFRLRHLRDLALYLQVPVRPAGQCESHWLSRLMARGSAPQPEAKAWALVLPPRTVGPGNSLKAKVSGKSLQNPASSPSTDQAKGVPFQSGTPESLRLRSKRSWGPSEESACPLNKRTRSGGPERP